MTISNSLKMKFASVFAIIVLSFFQWNNYSINKDKVHRSNDFITIEGKVVDHKDFNSISFTFVDINGKEVVYQRVLDGNYDPFIKLKEGDKVSITVDQGKDGVFYIDGYEDKPSSFSFYLIALLVSIAQIIFMAIIVDRFDERYLSLELFCNK